MQAIQDPDLYRPTGLSTAKAIWQGSIISANSTTMQQLLENEGITVENDRVQDFSEKFWDPSTELAWAFCITGKSGNIADCL